MLPYTYIKPDGSSNIHRLHERDPAVEIDNMEHLRHAGAGGAPGLAPPASQPLGTPPLVPEVPPLLLHPQLCQ